MKRRHVLLTATLIVGSVTLTSIWHTWKETAAYFQLDALASQIKSLSAQNSAIVINIPNPDASQNIEIMLNGLSVQEIVELYSQTPEFRFARKNFSYNQTKEGPYLCSAQKCLFPLENFDERIGYLVMPASSTKDRKALRKTYNFSTSVIDKQYGMRHTLLQPPQEFQAAEGLVNWMMRVPKISDSGSELKQTPNFTQSLLLQVVEVVPPKRRVVFGCSNDATIESVPKRKLQRLEENTEAMKRIPGEFAKLYKLLQDEACLLEDFQALLTTDGFIVHENVDRCFRINDVESKTNKNCVNNIKTFEAELLHRLKHGQQPQQAQTDTMNKQTPIANNPTKRQTKVQEIIVRHSKSAEFQFAEGNFGRGNGDGGEYLCGTEKCLFPLKNYGGRIGYLANRGNEARFYDRINKAYELSRDVIEKKYGMKHIFLFPPEELVIDPGLQAWLNNLSKTTDSVSTQPNYPNFPKEMVVQAVEIIPRQDSILFGCSDRRMRDGHERMKEVLAASHGENMDWNAAATQASLEFEKLYKLLNDIPCLTRDFQVFITTRGEIVHLDVERCYAIEYVSDHGREKGCLKNVQQFEEDFVQGLHELHKKQNSPNEVEIREIVSKHAKSKEFQFEQQNIARGNGDGGEYLCGTEKCLFPLKEYDGRVGYLVNRANEARFYDRILKGYKMSTDVIEGEFGMKHIFLLPPEELNIDQTFHDFLNNLSKATDSVSTQPNFPHFPKELVVQAVEIIPREESILFGCSDRRTNDGYERIKEVLSVSSQHPVEWRDALARARSEFQKLQKLLIAHPCLTRDFQLFLTRKGDMVHLDVERCYAIEYISDPEREKGCIKKIEKFVEYFGKTFEAVQGS